MGRPERLRAMTTVVAAAVAACAIAMARATSGDDGTPPEADLSGCGLERLRGNWAGERLNSLGQPEGHTKLVWRGDIASEFKSEGLTGWVFSLADSIGVGTILDCTPEKVHPKGIAARGAFRADLLATSDDEVKCTWIRTIEANDADSVLNLDCSIQRSDSGSNAFISRWTAFPEPEWLGEAVEAVIGDIRPEELSLAWHLERAVHRALDQLTDWEASQGAEQCDQDPASAEDGTCAEAHFHNEAEEEGDTLPAHNGTLSLDLITKHMRRHMDIVHASIKHGLESFSQTQTVLKSALDDSSLELFEEPERHCAGPILRVYPTGHNFPFYAMVNKCEHKTFANVVGNLLEITKWLIPLANQSATASLLQFHDGAPVTELGELENGGRYIIVPDQIAFAWPQGHAGYQRRLRLEPDGKEVTLESLSDQVRAFRVRGLLSPEECEYIISRAREPGVLKQSAIGDNDTQSFHRTSNSGWLTHDAMPQRVRDQVWSILNLQGSQSAEENEILRDRLIEKENERFASAAVREANREETLRYIREVAIAEHGEKAGAYFHLRSKRIIERYAVNPLHLSPLNSALQDSLDHSFFTESLQVIRYTVGQHYLAHFDATSDLGDSSTNRFATVLFYLNSLDRETQGGGTTFPWDGMQLTETSTDEDRIRATTESCQSGLTTEAQQGDAIIFYNLSPHLRPDLTSLHAGCDVTDSSATKWAANLWVKLSPAHFPQVFESIRDPIAGDMLDRMDMATALSSFLTSLELNSEGTDIE